MFALILILVLVGLGLAAAFGRTADSRDTRYSLGDVLRGGCETTPGNGAGR